MPNPITATTGSFVLSAQASQTKDVSSRRILPIFQQPNSPLDVTLTIPPSMIDSVEQVVPPALAAQSYQTCPIAGESDNNSGVSELGPRSGKL
ncbi:MAG: hypothetical protein ACRCYZ_05355 [Alphaproteobacteria bacterium]